ncbi:DUF3221 domain-containing protein [Chloroflexota bacterium]
MKIIITTLLLLFIIGVSLSSCVGSTSDAKVSLGDEFSLSVDQSVVITGEDLEIKFAEVSEDSRCAKGVTCIWEGRVTAFVEISKDGPTQQIELTEPGLTDAPSREIFKEYEITYKVEPYPEIGKQISVNEYRLLITVSLALKPLQPEADFSGFITEIHPVGKEDTLGQVLVESHADKLVDKYMVTIKDETLIFKQNRENHHKVAFEALETQQRIQIWFSGPIMESFPMQGTAGQIVVTE